MAERKYCHSHEWIEESDGVIKIGLSEYAQNSMGEIVFVELPSIGAKIDRGKRMCVLESVKAASDIYAPVSGEVAAVNTLLQEKPALINEDPLDRGWIVRITPSDMSETADLMSSAEYAAYTNGLDE